MSEQVKLEKSLSPLQVCALALGSIVGWGCFVLPGDMFLPQAGPVGTLLGFFVGACLISFAPRLWAGSTPFVVCETLRTLGRRQTHILLLTVESAVKSRERVFAKKRTVIVRALNALKWARMT